MSRHQTSNMFRRFTRTSTNQGDLVYKDDPEETPRRKSREEHSNGPRQEPPIVQGYDILTEDQDYMDTSNVFQTQAGYDPELSPENG